MQSINLGNLTTNYVSSGLYPLALALLRRSKVKTNGSAEKNIEDLFSMLRSSAFSLYPLALALLRRSKVKTSLF